MNLAKKHCVACKKGTKGLSSKEAAKLLEEVDGWKISKDKKWLQKSYTFKNFLSALHFTNKVGAVAEKENHHPDLKLGWGYVKIKLQTHAAGGLHTNDFILAAKIDAL